MNQTELPKKEPLQQPKEKFSLFWLAGVAFTFFIALIGYVFALLPGFHQIGQMATAILVAILFRQFFGYPEKLRAGINFSSKKILRFAIILYGLKLNIQTILNEGLHLLIRDAFVILFAILITMWLAKRFKANQTISLLAGIGTGVCGAAAIAAVAPIIKAKEEETAISVAMIALVGTIFSIIYTILRPLLPITELQYGIWSGTTLHELAHVALAADPAGEDALAYALLAKLGRVFLLVPLCLVLVYWVNRHKQKNENEKTKIDFPWFLIGFIIMSVIGTFVLDSVNSLSPNIMTGIANFTTWCLTAAMVGLGLNISLQDLRTKALKPLAAMVITSLLLSMIGYVVVQF